jgi:hypothetical protein
MKFSNVLYAYYCLWLFLGAEIGFVTFCNLGIKFDCGSSPLRCMAREEHHLAATTRGRSAVRFEMPNALDQRLPSTVLKNGESTEVAN